MIKVSEELAGVALQVAYEYPDWGEEHVSDMHATYRQTGRKAPFTADDLYEVTIQADALRRAGKSWTEAEKLLMG